MPVQVFTEEEVRALLEDQRKEILEYIAKQRDVMLNKIREQLNERYILRSEARRHLAELDRTLSGSPRI